MSKPKAVLITGDSYRHKFIAHSLVADLDLKLVLSEVKFDYVKAFEETDAANPVKAHFEARDRSERAYFGSYSFPENVVEIEKGTVNKPETIVEIDKANPDVIVLFGSSIIGKTILTKYENKVLNMHLGLSPYYRGSGTNFWPIVDGKPECVGVTFHVAVLKVDAGPILHQFRVPDLKPDDSIHDMGNKVIRKSGEVYPKVVLEYVNGNIKGVVQPANDSSDFKRLDLTKEALDAAYNNVKAGLFVNYLSQKDKRDANYPIQETERVLS